MRKSNSRLLITLVLLAVASAAAWTPAHARPREGTRLVRSHAVASVAVGSRPGMRPANGEPDVGLTRTPPYVTGRSGTFTDEEPVVDPLSRTLNWFSRIGMVWMARYLGVR